MVAYLDTGAGKTFVSVLLLKHRLELHQRTCVHVRTSKAERWLGVFLAPKVALVQQQAQVLRRHLPVTVTAYVGKDTESWEITR